MVLSLSTEGEKKRAEEEEEESSEVRAKLVAQNEIGKGATAFHGTRSGSLLEIVDGPLSNEVTEKEKESTIVEGKKKGKRKVKKEHSMERL